MSSKNVILLPDRLAISPSKRIITEDLTWRMLLYIYQLKRVMSRANMLPILGPLWVYAFFLGTCLYFSISSASLSLTSPTFQPLPCSQPYQLTPNAQNSKLDHSGCFTCLLSDCCQTAIHCQYHFKIEHFQGTTWEEGTGLT